MKIVWSPLAIERVREAADFIARDKPGTAERWAAGIVRAVERLGKMPRCGRIVPELSRPDVREIFHGAYRIIYGVSKGEVHILTVRHGKRILDAAETTEV